VLKNKLSPGYSLIEIIVVISLITILGYFISLSFNVLKNETILSKEDKINSMENEISQIKSKSLSQGKILSYSIEDELFQINAFKECSIKSNKNKKVYISSSGEVSPFQFDCIIGNKMWTFYMNRLGKVEVYETK
tara:strand:+ start:1116 stop:1520 length:405 start_codon:yes stop_codon:yes gene_type:complete